MLLVTVWDRQCLEDISTKDQSINQLINYKGVQLTGGLAQLYTYLKNRCTVF